MQLGIFGVGRSGTTALYTGVQHMVLAAGTPCRFLYEPYLWSHQVFDAPFAAVTKAFGSTASLSAEGLYAHHATPLFAEQGNSVHDQFLATITQGSENFLIKAIRANGRLQLFLEAFPELKAVVIIRNPLDVINSVIDRFSFFGDEFHPSDKPRFLEAVTQRFAIATPTTTPITSLRAAGPRSEVDWSLLWWRYMTLAALETAQRYPDRVLVVAYEMFNRRPVPVLQHVGGFLGLNTNTLGSYEARQPVGEVTKRVYLHPNDISMIQQQGHEYWQTLIARSAIAPDAQTLEQLRAATDRTYQNAPQDSAPPQSIQIPPDSSALLVRRQLLQVTAENNALRASQLSAAPPLALGNGDGNRGADWEHQRFVSLKSKAK